MCTLLKAHKVSLQYMNGPSSTLSNFNISKAILQIVIKFYV